MTAAAREERKDEATREELLAILNPWHGKDLSNAGWPIKAAAADEAKLANARADRLLAAGWRRRAGEVDEAIAKIEALHESLDPAIDPRWQNGFHVGVGQALSALRALKVSP